MALVLSFWVICLSKDTAEDRALITYLYDSGGNSALFSQALAVEDPHARLVHYQNNPAWSFAQKQTWLSHPSTRFMAETDHQQGLLWLQQNQPGRAIKWLRSAANKDHVGATIRLAEVLLAQQNSERAGYWLARPYLKGVAEAERLQVQRLLNLNQFELAVAKAARLAGQRDGQAAQMAGELEVLLRGEHKPSEGHCQLHLTMYVDGYLSLQRARQLREQWNNSPDFGQLPICISASRHFDSSECVAPRRQADAL